VIGSETREIPGAAGASSAEREVLAEQTRQLYAALPSILTITSLAATLLVVTRSAAPAAQGPVIAWAVAFALLTALRAAQFVAFRRARPGPTRAGRWYAGFAVLTTLSGLLWGASAWVFLTGDSQHTALLTFIVAGLGAGALVNLSARWQCAWLFLLPATVPFMLRFLTLDAPMAEATAALIALFIVALLVMSRRLGARTRTQIASRLALSARYRHTRRDRQHYQSLVESTIAVIWEGDPDTLRFTYVSPESTQLLGYSPGQWTADPSFWPDHIHPDDREWAVSYCREATRRMERHEFDYRMIAADGRTVWLHDVVNVIARDGRPERLVGVMIDITPLKQVQRELEYVSGLQRLLVDVSRALLEAGEEGLDAVFSETLERIGRWCRVDRAYLIWFTPDLDAYTNTHEWVAEGISAERDNLQNVPSTTIPRLLERLKRKQSTALPRVAELDESWANEKQLFGEEDIQSLIVLPIFCEGRLAGLIGFDSVREQRDWGDEEAALLQGLGDLIGVAVERSRKQRSLRHSEDLRRHAEALAGMGSWEWEVGSERFRASGEWRNVTGCGPGELSREQVLALTPEPDRRRVEAALEQTIESGCEYNIEHRIRRADTGEERWLEVHAELEVRADGKQVLRGFAQDVTARRAAEAKLYRLAHFDSLTSLPNRVLVVDRLEQAVRRARRGGGRVGVLFIDLDDFKKVNDTLGHDAGDRLLVESAARLVALFRERDTVARIGGDEFLVVLEEIRDGRDAGAAAAKVLAAFRQPLAVAERAFVLTASVGIAVMPTDGQSAHELMRRADTAMYHAKRRGRDAFQFFTETMNEAVERQLEIEQALTGALGAGQLTVHYQPVVRLSDHCCIGAEALLRWRHPVLGDVAPDEFITVAERSGRIDEIGRFVIREVTRQLAEWRRELAPAFRVSVNVSPRQFRDESIAEQIIAKLDRAGLPGSALEVEVTEGLLLPERAAVSQALEALRSHGVGLVMDDFGTGYASLRYLRDYPFSSLKIDRDFVRRLDADERHRKLVVSAIRLGQALGMQVIAEGVENEDELAVLKAEGCELVQGYLFSAPVDAAAMTGILSRKGAPMD